MLALPFYTYLFTIVTSLSSNQDNLFVPHQSKETSIYDGRKMLGLFDSLLPHTSFVEEVRDGRKMSAVVSIIRNQFCR